MKRRRRKKAALKSTALKHTGSKSTGMQATARTMFRSLRVRNYRLFYGGQLVSVSGTWMQSVAQGWLVLKLTGSGFAVGLVTALQFLPVLLFGAWGGVIADRFDKRRTLLATQVCASLLAAALAVVTLSGVVTVWMVAVIALGLGCVTVIDTPTRQAFVTEMVGRDELANAIALNSAQFNASRVIGPGVAGALILSAGTGVCFALNAVSYLAVIAGLLRMDPTQLHRGIPVAKAKGQVREGLRYVAADPVLRSTLLTVGVVGTLALNFSVVLPVLAKRTFSGNAATFGIMMSVMGLGSLCGALFVAWRARPTRGFLIGSCVVFGTIMLATAAAPTFTAVLPLLFLTGGSAIAFMSTANSTLQLRSTDQMRGRVMALYSLVFLGSTPLGGPLVGWIAQVASPRWALGLGAVATLLAGLWGTTRPLRIRWASGAGRVAVPEPNEPAAA